MGWGPPRWRAPSRLGYDASQLALPPAKLSLVGNFILFGKKTAPTAKACPKTLPAAFPGLNSFGLMPYFCLEFYLDKFIAIFCYKE